MSVNTARLSNTVLIKLRLIYGRELNTLDQQRIGIQG